MKGYTQRSCLHLCALHLLFLPWLLTLRFFHLLDHYTRFWILNTISIPFLEDRSEKHCGTVLDPTWGSEFREAIYEVQDLVDLYLCSVLAADHDDRSSSSEANCDKVSLDQDLNMALERIDFIREVSMKMKESIDTAEDIRPVTYYYRADPSSTVETVVKTVEVGVDDDFNAIKERVYDDSDKLQIIPIVGMGGIGKTTLARKVYDDLLLARHFDIHAWITMSAEYQRREILLGLLRNFKISESELFGKGDAQLAKLAYQNLIGRRYLIVIDDIWSTEAWDYLKMVFPDDESGSRILLTTRILDVAVYSGSSSNPLHQMNCLSDNHSWKLLQERIFGQESCPRQLVEIGKKIARNCKGLPLTVVVVAGLILSSGNITNQELWENISENISSTEPIIALQCSKILCLSYDKLPLRLKPCFLYMAAFPEDMKINVSKLMKLWVAEGFVRPNDQSKCLEDVGEGYLEELVNRSLILAGEKGWDGKLETVGIHDMLRDICMTKAEEDGFLLHVSSKRNTQNEVLVDNPVRRFSFHFPQRWPIKDPLKDLRVRSLLLFWDRELTASLSQSRRHLSILDASKLTWPNLSDEISTFVNLRYIAIALNSISCPHGFPASISKLPNLQAIIAHLSSHIEGFEVPYEIWEMRKLRHLIMNVPFRLLYPSNVGVVHESGLLTLDEVINFRLTEETIKTLVNLKKLAVVFAMSDGENWEGFNLENFVRLQNLQELKVSVHNLYNITSVYDFPISVKKLEIWSYAFPISLKKLSLFGVPLPWKNMTIIGSLPNLQVLHMMSTDVAEASEWTPMEGEFLQLKDFHSSLDKLVKWEVEKEHFPRLESLTLHRAWIDEIPCGIGEIDSLQVIELVRCSPSLVTSALQILEKQHENGNYAFQLRVV